MLKLFRNIRQSLLNEGKTTKPASRTGRYFKYAIGEIILVVIGILIALQINNWNENQKSKKDEVYVLTEILKNLEEEAILVHDILLQRQKAKIAITSLLKFVKNEPMSIDSVQYYMVNVFTFERYFPINNAYEILKSKGLKLSDNSLTTKISRYYDYEQPQMSSSILDIELPVLKIFNDPNGLMRFFLNLQKDRQVLLKNSSDPEFISELSSFLLPFQDNSGGTLNKLFIFEESNSQLRQKITETLKLLN